MYSMHDKSSILNFVQFTASCSCLSNTEMGEEFATLSHRAEVFRSKLIEDFQILESISEKGRLRAPVYNSSDITGGFS